MYRIIELNTVDEKILQECLQLMWETQGKNVTTLDALTTAATSDDSLFLVVLDENDHVIGGAVGKIVTKGFEFYAPFGQEVLRKLHHSKVGSLSIMGIHPRYQGQGIGQQLSRRRVEWLKARGCNFLIGITWVSGLAHTSDRVFQKVGFKAVKTLENFFEEFSISLNLICPVCGDPPCKCPGTLFVMDV